MGVDHVLDRVGDQLARRQTVEHALVPHRDPVVDRDGVELLGHGAGLVDLLRDEIPQGLQMDVARHELRVRVGDGDDRLDQVRFGGAGGAPQRARRHLRAALSGSV